jgi:ribosome-associated toxin RatA of RatAB toxin-antitoxin module
LALKTITRSAIVPHSARAMYALVEDIESYPRFLPWCAEAKVHERRPGETRATLTARLSGLRQSFTTRNENRPDAAIDMRLVQGPFRTFAGAWRFRPLSAHSCEIEFTLQYEMASRALGKLLEPLFDRIANTMVDAFTRRAEEVHGGA